MFFKITFYRSTGHLQMVEYKGWKLFKIFIRSALNVSTIKINTKQSRYSVTKRSVSLVTVVGSHLGGFTEVYTIQNSNCIKKGYCCMNKFWPKRPV